MALTSLLACSWMTYSDQPRRRDNGRGGGRASSGYDDRRGERLDQRQPSARSTSAVPKGISLDEMEHLVVIFRTPRRIRVESAQIDRPGAHAVAMILPPLDVRVDKPLQEAGTVVVTPAAQAGSAKGWASRSSRKSACLRAAKLYRRRAESRDSGILLEQRHRPTP